MLQHYSSPLTTEGLQEVIEEFSNKVVNIVEEHIYIVFNINNNVSNNGNAFVNNSLYSPEDLDVMRTL